MKEELTYVPIGDLKVSTLNVRQTQVSTDIESLVESVRKFGVLQPLVVRKVQDNQFEIIVGQRRFQAAKKAGLSVLPCRITEQKKEGDLIALSFSENIHRTPLTPDDSMKAAVHLMKIFHDDHEKVAEQLGVTERTLRNYLGWSSVPEDVKKFVGHGMTRAQAIRISQVITDAKKIVALAQRISSAGSSVLRREIANAACKNPTETPEEILRIAKGQTNRQLSVVLSQEISDALTEAVKKYEAEKEEIIEEALRDWLRTRSLI